MANRYTDVDLMLLERWDEVKGLREAFSELLDRMRDAVEHALGKVKSAALERGFSCEFDSKQPIVYFWKKEWATRSNEACIYFELSDFAPIEYGKVEGDHPAMWLIVEDLRRLKIRESHEDFAKVLKAELAPTDLLDKWKHDDADSDSPLGKECSDVSDEHRVHLVTEPEAFIKYVIERLDEFAELVPAIDQALQKMARR